MATPDRKTQDYSFAGGLGNINPAEMPEESIQKYRDTLDEQVKALQKRYEQPNYWKVAAGFAKPQLGGFLASLGSAAEAMGENVEQRREQELPIAQMKVQMEQANMLLSQKQRQNEIFQEWLAKNTKPDGTKPPMDATTYSRITSLGENTDVAKAASKYFEGAKAGLEITGGAAEISAKYPQLGTSLDNYTRFQLNPDADEKAIKQSRADYINQLNSSMPPQMDKNTWLALSIPDKQKAVDEYGRRQLEAGMNTEAGLQQQASQAPSRLTLLGSIRDLAMGVGLKDIEKDGKTVSGRDQIASLLNYFGGNNPFEVFARAASDNKLGDKLADIDKYARQSAMSPEARDHFQKLVKLLAENQVTLRNGALNPTDQFSALQTVSQPNISNSQTALVTLVDLMGHGEKNLLDKYRYVLDNKIPFRQLGVDPDYLTKQAEYAKEHRRIATSNPFENSPSWYNPAAGSKPVATSKPAAPESQKPETQTNKPSQNTARRIRSADDLLREAGVKP